MLCSDKAMNATESNHAAAETPKPFLVAAFYRFVPLPDYRAMRSSLQQRCEDLGLLGTILLAEEGINGTVSGPEKGVRRPPLRSALFLHLFPSLVPPYT